MSAAWRLIELSAPEDPVWNMAFDTALLASPADASPTLRFYQWSRPAISIGYFQNIDNVVRAHDCLRSKIVVVRRPTGGGLVHHGNDLTLSLSLPENDLRFAGGVSESYRTVHTVILHALRPMFKGLDFTSCLSATGMNARGSNDRVCFEEPVSCDLEWQGRKAVGSSQRRKNGRILHQTSIQVVGDVAEMARRLVGVFTEQWGITFEHQTSTKNEITAARAIADGVYSSPEWTFNPSSN